MKKNKRTTFTLEEEHSKKLEDIEQEVKTFTNFGSQSSFIRYMLAKINSGEYDFLEPEIKEEKKDAMYLVSLDEFNLTKEQAKSQGYTTAKNLIMDVIDYEHKRMENGEIPFSPKD